MTSQKGSVSIIIGIVVLVMLAAVGGYLFAKVNLERKPVENPPVAQSIIKDNKMNPGEAAPEANFPSQPTLPEGWVYQKSLDCNINLPLPPERAPYSISANQSAQFGNDAGSYWKIIEQPYSGGGKMFSHESWVFFTNDKGGDYLGGLVQVICGPNTKNQTSQQFVDEYKKQLASTSLTFVQVGLLPMWGRSVVAASISGGMYSPESEFYFATPQYLYRIRSISESSNQFVKDTTNQILKNLQLLN